MNVDSTASRFPITFFKSYSATKKEEVDWSLKALARRIETVTAPQKADLPWLKLAKFGDIRTSPKNSLRHDANVLAVTGIEADYDGEKVSLSAAVKIATKAGILALIYTSPSHTEDAPRWRVLCPLSHEIEPDLRAKMLGRLNGLYRGILAGESWTLSQSYYYGSVAVNPSHRVKLIDGTPIDLHDDLDKIWLGKPHTSPHSNGNGQAQPFTSGPADEAALLEQIATSASYHESGVRLLGKWALAGMPLIDARSKLTAAMDTVPETQRDSRWAARVADIDRCLMDIYGKEARAKDNGHRPTPDPELLANPDMSILRLSRRAPPALPLDVFGPGWAMWISAAAEAAAAPPDYVAVPLLASSSALIGHARWAQATPGWMEPPHIWAGSVGDSGSSKSPGADCLLRDVLPVIEQRMMGDFPDHLRDWRAAAEAATAAQEQWKADVRTAQKSHHPPPLPPAEIAPAEPQAPRLRQSDVTVEKVAALLANAAPKGLMIVRDELAGWLLGLNSYNDAGRSFWIEAYGGRPYRVERVKSPEPIVISRLAVAVTGTTQPGRLAEMFREADDGLLGRFVWAWPDPLPFRLGQNPPAIAWAIDALDKLRLLDLAPGEQPHDPPRPILVPLSPAAVSMMEAFGQDMQRRQQEAGGLLQSAYGKARGLALRLSLVLTMLRWCGSSGMTAPPVEIGEQAFGAACDLVADYFLPMAERVYGDAAATPADRNAATLARWIIRERAPEVHVRRLQREVRLPGLNSADVIHAAAAVLVEAGWLLPPEAGGFQQRARAAYLVNVRLFELAS